MRRTDGLHSYRLSRLGFPLGAVHIYCLIPISTKLRWRPSQPGVSESRQQTRIRASGNSGTSIGTEYPPGAWRRHSFIHSLTATQATIDEASAPRCADCVHLNAILPGPRLPYSTSTVLGRQKRTLSMHTVAHSHGSCGRLKLGSVAP